MLADDTTWILEDIKSVEIARKAFEKFGHCSGFNLNLEKKTEITSIGTNKINFVMQSSLLGKIRVTGVPLKSC